MSVTVFSDREIEIQAIGLEVFAETGSATPHGLRVAAQMLRQQNAEKERLRLKLDAAELVLQWLEASEKPRYLTEAQNARMSREERAKQTMLACFDLAAQRLRSALHD